MRNLKILFLCFCLILSSFVFVASKERRTDKSPVVETTIQNSFPNVFRPIGNWFKKLFGKRKDIGGCTMADVQSVELSRTEVTTNCLNGVSCKDNAQSIDVSTIAIDSEGDLLIYDYKVSDGEIIGKGSKVVWNLSGAKPGTYTITAAVDDGCGYCGKTITKEVKVIECPDCK